MSRAGRICTEAGCPTVVHGTNRCPEHARPQAHKRGYGSAHRRLRANWAPRVQRGDVTCWRCGLLIAPTDQWDLGHDDGDRSITRGPEHARGCNRAAAGRASHGCDPSA